MALTTRSIHSSFTAIPHSSSLSYASASSAVLGKAAFSHHQSLGQGTLDYGLTGLQYNHPESSYPPALSTMNYPYNNTQRPVTRPRSSAFYRRSPPSMSSPSYRRTHLASLALAPPTGPITYDPFKDPEADSNGTSAVVTPRLRTRRAIAVLPPSLPSPRTSPASSTAASTHSHTHLAPDEKMRHSKLIAGILLNRIHPVGKPMKRCPPLPAEGGPKPYVRSRLSASTLAVEC